VDPVPDPLLLRKSGRARHRTRTSGTVAKVLFQCLQCSPNCRQSVFLARVISSALKMKATRFSETSVYNKHTRRHIPKDGILRSRRRENLKSYVGFYYFALLFIVSVSHSGTRYRSGSVTILQTGRSRDRYPITLNFKFT
jgi:hypothetical protein